jgi:putative FmdB family regulatory protein
VPLYEYECDACGRRFEVIQKKFSDPPVEVCRECGKGPVRRLLSSPAIQFKGSGFYITDYAKKGKSDSSSTTPSDKTNDSAKTDSSTESSSTAKSDTAKSDTTTIAPKKDAPASTPKSKE